MTRSAVRTRRWSRTIVAFAADIVLYTVTGLVLWAVLLVVALGFQPIVVTSGSMSPAIEPGDIVLITDDIPADERFAQGTIITFEDTSPTASGLVGPGDRRLVTHRVQRVTDDGAYITRGDANVAEDPRPVEPEAVAGGARLLIPWLGLPVHWARTGEFHLVVLAVLVLVGAAVLSRLDTDDEVPPPPTSDPTRPHLPGPRSRDGLAPIHLTSTVDEARTVGAQRRRTRDAQAADLGPDAVVLPSRNDRLPSVGAIVVALGLAAASLTPAAQAAFSAEVQTVGNAFATAPGPPPPDGDAFVLPDLDGQLTVAGGGGQGDTYSFEITVDDAVQISGPAVAELLVRRAQNGTNRIDVTFAAGDEVLAEGSMDNFQIEDGWQQIEIPLTPTIDATFPAGTTFTVEVTLVRLELDLSGSSAITIQE